MPHGETIAVVGDTTIGASIIMSLFARITRGRAPTTLMLWPPLRSTSRYSSTATSPSVVVTTMPTAGAGGLKGPAGEPVSIIRSVVIAERLSVPVASSAPIAQGSTVDAWKVQLLDGASTSHVSIGCATQLPAAEQNNPSGQVPSLLQLSWHGRADGR